MSIRYRIHKNLQIVHMDIGQDFASSDLCAYSDQIRHDPNFDSTFDHLIEFPHAGARGTGAEPSSGFLKDKPIALGGDS